MFVTKYFLFITYLFSVSQILTQLRLSHFLWPWCYYFLPDFWAFRRRHIPKADNSYCHSIKSSFVQFFWVILLFRFQTEIIKDLRMASSLSLNFSMNLLILISSLIFILALLRLWFRLCSWRKLLPKTTIPTSVL